MKITLIRHTRVAVETGICYGWSDVGVAPSFETEASRVKENISNERFDIVYSSPLSRCRKLAAFCGFHEPILDDRLKELNFGEWEMKKWDDLTDSRLELWYKDWIHLPAGGGKAMKISAAVSLNFWMNSAIPAIPMPVFSPTGESSPALWSTQAFARSKNHSV